MFFTEFIIQIWLGILTENQKYIVTLIQVNCTYVAHSEQMLAVKITNHDTVVS